MDNMHCKDAGETIAKPDVRIITMTHHREYE